MFSLFTNPVLSPLIIFLIILNALGALYALYWNIRASDFKLLKKVRWNVVGFAFLHFIWFISLLFTPILPSLWLKIYFALNVVTWHFGWSAEAIKSEFVREKYGEELEAEVERQLKCNRES